MSKHMLVLQLCCPQCGSTLTDGTKVRLDAHMKESHQDGEMTLSAVFGDYSIETDLALTEGATIEFRCPKCDASIMLPVTCKLCGAPMASLNLKTGGYLEFCSRYGCKAHAIGGVGDIDEMMSLMNKMFDTPYD
ncbi:MAG: hypothetical protein ACE15D_06490 [Candidatus Eisenbacteria bacterium]|nr:hypothetical protein [Candidatus Eisenbacteria bacterium]